MRSIFFISFDLTGNISKIENIKKHPGMLCSNRPGTLFGHPGNCCAATVLWPAFSLLSEAGLILLKKSFDSD
jgi:hypothetical protein